MIKCIVPDFKGPFELLLNYECLVHIKLDISQVDDRKTLAKSKNISLMANKEYNYLNVSGKWNIPGGHYHVHMLGDCFSCDSVYNIIPKFPHTCNEEKTNIERER